MAVLFSVPIPDRPKRSDISGPYVTPDPRLRHCDSLRGMPRYPHPRCERSALSGALAVHPSRSVVERCASMEDLGGFINRAERSKPRGAGEMRGRCRGWTSRGMEGAVGHILAPSFAPVHFGRAPGRQRKPRHNRQSDDGTLDVHADCMCDHRKHRRIGWVGAMPGKRSDGDRDDAARRVSGADLFGLATACRLRAQIGWVGYFRFAQGDGKDRRRAGRGHERKRL